MSDPNCTTGNARACNNANGFFDYAGCTCAFPQVPGAVPEGYEPYRGTKDEQVDKMWDNYFDMESSYYSLGRWCGINTLVAMGLSTVVKSMYSEGGSKGGSKKKLRQNKKSTDSEKYTQ